MPEGSPSGAPVFSPILATLGRTGVLERMLTISSTDFAEQKNGVAAEKAAPYWFVPLAWPQTKDRFYGRV